MEKVKDIASLKKIHAYAIENDYDLTKLMKIVARSSSKGVDVLGTVDYETLNVTFDAQIDSDLVLDVFVNRTAVNEIMASMSSDTFFSNQYAMTPLEYVFEDANGELQTAKVRVYSFASASEMNSTDIDKMLRVQTIYGVGYIGLVPEGTTNASDIKICLGYNKYGNPIIRCLEKVE